MCTAQDKTDHREVFGAPREEKTEMSGCYLPLFNSHQSEEARAWDGCYLCGIVESAASASVADTGGREFPIAEYLKSSSRSF